MEVLPEGVSVPLKKGPGLYEFLVEAELHHYFTSFKNTLKITHPSQLKFTTEGDLAELGMSKPEMRRLRKYYEKHFPNNYLSKFKKLLLASRKQENNTNEPMPSNDNVPMSRAPRVPSKHIIPAANITVNKELGVGEFGIVQQGVWCNDGERIQVAIKCLARERMQTNTIEFLKEATIMHSIDHNHIVRLFGVVLDTSSFMLVTELAPLRSLLECLKEPSLRSSFPVLTLCDFAVQICDGMQYLEAKRLIHRDLAARNILVFSKNKVKISDFGLSRALGQGKDYYQTNFNVNLKLPIAWCAPECISYLRFTSASDVWAFGVTLWEMFSYGFQPWAALTGQQILEAIDEPNFQRLEQPDCCPQEHYALMLDCWRHEAVARPRFIDIATRLVDCRPEQVQAKLGSADAAHLLPYRTGDVITVLDKMYNTPMVVLHGAVYTNVICFSSHRPYWKGVTANGKTGLFDPSNVVAYLGSDLPSATFMRNDSTRTSARRKLRSEMISAPQGDLKHTGHVGLDGAYFGDLSFLGGAKVDVSPDNAPKHLARGYRKHLQYGGIPTQVVAPYRPHEDIEAAPLLDGDRTNPPPPAPAPDHEYHEISDEEANHSPPLDLGPSLMAEMEMMFNNLGQTPTSPADHEGANKSNEHRERMSKPRKPSVLKQISAQDQKTLDAAIEFANELSTRSMSAPAPTTPSSPSKRKFSFRFPSVSEHHHHDKTAERRNYSEEVQSTPDLQSKVTAAAQLAYQNLVESPTNSDIAQFMNTNPLKLLRSGALPTVKPRQRTATLPHSYSTKSQSQCKPSFNTLDTKRSGSAASLELPRDFHMQELESTKEENPIPLPPRDRNKLLLASKPRHTRKHPLIIPSSSIQSTLNKFSAVTPPIVNDVEIDHADSVYANDTESIHFEQRIDSELAALDDLSGEHDSVDSPYDADAPQEGAQLQRDYVSCEDLLEFADAKPSSRARGFESDEVRLMCKVLRQEVSADHCLRALEFTNWDVGSAIKLCKVQKVVVGAELITCNDALVANGWDEKKAAQWILHQDSEVQV